MAADNFNPCVRNPKSRGAGHPGQHSANSANPKGSHRVHPHGDDCGYKWYVLVSLNAKSIMININVLALLERKGTRHAFVVTKGFRDLIEIGHQSRPKLFALDHRKPETLYDVVVEINERITVEGFEEGPDKLDIPDEEVTPTLVEGLTGDVLRIIKPLNHDEVRSKLAAIKQSGIDALAICFAHSYLYPRHEDQVALIAVELGFTHVSTSSSVGAKMIKMITRGSSASADAYLTPEIQRYVETFARGFDGASLDGVRCEFMQSDGGLVNYRYFSGLKAILSGPAGESLQLGPLVTFTNLVNFFFQVVLLDMHEPRTMERLPLSGLTWEAPPPTSLDTEASLSTSSKPLQLALRFRAPSWMSTQWQLEEAAFYSGKMGSSKLVQR